MADIGKINNHFTNEFILVHKNVLILKLKTYIQ